MEKVKQNKTQSAIVNVCLTALMAAMVTVLTAFVQIKTGINEGYIHFGDSMVYLASSIVGFYGIFSAAIGGALADIVSGAAVWAPITAVIKALNCLPILLAMYICKNQGKGFKIINPFTIIASIASGLITIFGYLLAEGLMYSFPSAWASVPFSCIQSFVSAAIFIVVGLALDKAKINKFLKK